MLINTFIFVEQRDTDSTHRLAQDWVFGAVDATCEHSEGQSCMEAEVQERMPAFPADPDGTVGNGDFILGTNVSGSSMEIGTLVPVQSSVYSGNSAPLVGLGAICAKDEIMGQRGK